MAYLLCFINIINIIDGLDGLACGVVMISAATIGIISLHKGAFEAALLTTAILGSCLAFLRYNVHPARIFMGDSGALFLGFLLGLASLDGVVRTPALISVLVPIVAAGIPVLDAAMAIIRRFRAKQSIMERDAGHIHHRLVDSGMSHRTTVLVILLLSAFLALCALLFATYTDFVIRIVIVVALVIFIPILVWRLRLVQPALQHVYHPRPKKELPQGTNRISASIVTYNSESKIVPLLRSMQRLLDTTRLDVFVIDNASADNTVAEVKNNAPWATVITNEYNRGFGAGHNQVLSVLQSKYHVVINPDIELIEDSISELASFMDKNPEVVMVVPKVLNPDGSEQKLPKLQPEPRYLLARRLEGKSEREIEKAFHTKVKMKVFTWQGEKDTVHR